MPIYGNWHLYPHVWAFVSPYLGIFLFELPTPDETNARPQVLLIVSSMGPAVIALTFSTYFLSLFMDSDSAHFVIVKKLIAALAIGEF